MTSEDAITLTTIGFLIASLACFCGFMFAANQEHMKVIEDVNKALEPGTRRYATSGWRVNLEAMSVDVDYRRLYPNGDALRRVNTRVSASVLALTVAAITVAGWMGIFAGVAIGLFFWLMNKLSGG
jgi:hypothetical protein